MPTTETTLARFGETGTYNPTKHIGMWVHIDDEVKTQIKDKFPNMQRQGFNMASSALILDVPKDKIHLGENWEDRLVEYTNVIQSTVNRIRTVGQVYASPCLMGNKDDPQFVIFFGTTATEGSTRSGVSENVLMMQIPSLFKTEFRPQSWGMKRDIPTLGNELSGMLKIQDVLHN